MLDAYAAAAGRGAGGRGAGGEQGGDGLELLARLGVHLPSVFDEPDAVRRRSGRRAPLPAELPGRRGRLGAPGDRSAGVHVAGPGAGGRADDPATETADDAGSSKATEEIDAQAFTRDLPAASGRRRHAAVLVLLGDGAVSDGVVSEGADGPDVLLLRRADTLGSHPGQVAFPGGATDPADDGPVGTALREAFEETGVLAEGVRPLAMLPELYVPVSGFLVTPVLAHWEQPSPVAPVDPAETAAVARVPIAHLADPANRFRVRHPSGYVGAAFSAPGMLVWGFTAGLLSGLLDARRLGTAVGRHRRA